MTILAVDPGKSGGMVLFDSEAGDGVYAVGFTRIQLVPMPPTEGDLVNFLAGQKIDMAVVEELPLFTGNAIPGARLAILHRNYGFLLGALAALNIPVRLVRPQVWQRALNLGTSKSHASKTAWKNHLKGAAQRLHPSLPVTLATADALLILEWALQNCIHTN